MIGWPFGNVNEGTAGIVIPGGRVAVVVGSAPGVKLTPIQETIE